ncbi:MAG TPA: hypothetical protein PLI77_06410 [Bacteroidales bacterium]|nr:hypothetical protein [Bacteroidales bacterium]
MKPFLKKNFSIYHVLGIVLGLILALIYWWKAGQFTDYFLKNNIFAVSIFGILIGYISFDLIINSLKKNQKENDH